MAFEYITSKHYPVHDLVPGDDWRYFIPIVQADRSTAFDFAGWNAFAQVRSRNTGTLIAEFDTYDGTIEFADNGMYLIADKDVTKQIINQRFIWDCQFLDPWGYSRTLILKSPFELEQEITD